MARIMDRVRIDERALESLTTGFRGEIVRPEDPSYEEHRHVWNGSIDRHPAVVARCAGVADVIAAVRFGRETGLKVAVRGGGHSFPGQSVCDDGLVIDHSLMRGIRVDPARRTVRVQAGVLLGELDRETQQFGMAVPAGIVTHTGVAGLTLGGGIGWLQRKLGLTIDQLLSVDVVTADGEFVSASAEENDDLFWGLRGGGGNFGIVTDFEFKLNPVGPTILGGPIGWPMAKSGDVLRFYRDWIKDAPDELMTLVVHRTAPPVPFIPPELHGTKVVMVAACWSGDLDEGEKFLKPLREYSSPAFDACGPKPFVTLQGMFDPSFPHGRWYYFRAANLTELSDGAVDTIAEHAAKMESPLTAFPLWQMGGAIARVGDDDTAYTGRAVEWNININAATEGPEGFEAERDWVRAFWSALEPWHTSVYVNFLMDEGEDRIRQAYGAEKYDRLKALKKKYDPDNFFRLNQNIPPD